MTLTTGGGMTDRITTTRALLEQALEALWKMTKKFNFERLHESRLSDSEVRVSAHNAMNAIRAELAKPVEQAKPVAWMDDFGNVFPIGANKGSGSWMDAHQRSWKPLYLHQPTPTWHDSPETIALKAELDLARAQLEAEHRINSETLSILERTEQNLSALLKRAAIAKAEGRTE